MQLLIIAFLLGPGSAGADHAITHHGRHLTGTLRTRGFLPDNTDKALPLTELRSVRFADQPAPLPRCRLWHQLHLRGEQWLSGELLKLRPKEVQFRIASGASITLGS